MGRIEELEALLINEAGLRTRAERDAGEAVKRGWAECRAWVGEILDGRRRAIPPADKLGARLFRLAELEERERLAQQRAMEDDDHPSGRGGR